MWRFIRVIEYDVPEVSGATRMHAASMPVSNNEFDDVQGVKPSRWMVRTHRYRPFGGLLKRKLGLRFAYSDFRLCAGLSAFAQRLPLRRKCGFVSYSIVPRHYSQD